jgi:hypothetical protein
LDPFLVALREVRHLNEDTLAKASMSQIERRRLHRSRPEAARYWRLLTDLNAKEAGKVIQLGTGVARYSRNKNGLWDREE